MKPRLDVRTTRRLDPGLRLAILATTALAGLATVPTHGADATLSRDRRPVTMSGSDRWRLRPTETNIVLPTATGPRLRAAVPIPEERRQVRQVYPAFTEMR